MFFVFSQCFTIAFANGCEDCCSKLYNIGKSFCLFDQKSKITEGLPCVIVPVLSNIIVSILLKMIF